MEQAERIIELWLEAGDTKYPLDLRGLGLRRIPDLPSTVEVLYLNGNDLNALFLPDSIRILDVSNNYITIIHHLPANLKEFYGDNNLVQHISYFPNNLKYIKLCGNMLATLPPLPDKLRALYVSNNQLVKTPFFPQSLRYIDISYNNITDISTLPDKLSYLWCHANNLKTIPDLPHSLVGGTISYKNPVSPDEQQNSVFPHIRGSMIQEYRERLQNVKINKIQKFVNTIREELMKTVWNPSTKVGEYLVLNELND